MGGSPAPRRRGLAGQLPAREAECRAREAVARLAEGARGQGLTHAQLAAALGLDPRTLRRTRAQARAGLLVPRALGRPPRRGTPAERNEVLACLREAGGRLGLPALQGLFPHLSRHELRELCWRARAVRTRRGRVVIEAQTWTRPGAVWAMDHSKLEHPLEGNYEHVLVVRDLASGVALLALPCESQVGEEVRNALRFLFAQAGAPLVVKADNGAAFVAEATQALLGEHRALLLYSPPYAPWFNGACEAGIGSLKARALPLAARAGRPDTWTCEDLEAARLQANETARPWGAKGPTPGERWRARERVSDELRAQVLADVVQRRARLRAAHGLGEAPGEPRLEAQVERAAIAGSLQAAGLVCRSYVEIPARRSSRRAGRNVSRKEVHSASN